MAEPDGTWPLVVGVVLNWNGYDDTRECLVSLSQVAYPALEILVVDNGSTDDSPDRIQAEHPDISLLRCPENRGIAAGYNRGIEAALARGAVYVMVMNNDLAFAPDFLTAMVRTQQQWPGCGVVMPKIFYYEAPDVIWSTGGRTRWMASNILLRHRRQKDGPATSKTEAIDFAPSCCLLISRAAAQRAAFDEAYFFYYDDWDFSLQVRQHGFQIVFAADSHLWHKVSRSTQNSPKSLRWWKILGQSCVRFHRKHHSGRLLWTYVGWVMLRETLKGNLRSLPTFLAGVRAGLQARTETDGLPEWRT